MFYYGFDWTYLVLVLPAMLFSLWASARVKSAYQTYGKTRTLRGLTGQQAAREVLRKNGVFDVRIERIEGELTDHYDPRNNVIRLSAQVYDGASAASVGVAAHEAGHAVQYAQNYAPIKFRAAIVNATNFASKLSVPLIFISLLLMSLELFLPYQNVLYYIAIGGVLCFGMCVVFQLVTLPVEYNASRRAMQAIEQSRMLTEPEQKAARKMLNAAALTYVAALTVTLAQFMRLLLIVTRNRRDD